MNKRTLACLLFAVWSLTTVGLVYGQETSYFILDGTVKQPTGEGVAGHTVTAINQRVPTGWISVSEFTTRDYDPSDPRSKPEDKGTYTIVYLNTRGDVTKVGDEIVITVIDTGGTETTADDVKVGGKTYTVTASDIEARGTTVDIILEGIQVALDPNTLDADGSSTSTITININDAEGVLVKDDTLTITSVKDATISEVIDNRDGSYTATYTAPALVDITEATTDQLTVISMTLGEDESATASLTLNVPKTVVMVAVSPSAEFSSVSSDTGAVSVTVMRAGMPIPGETISFEWTRTDGGTDVGSITDAVDAGVDGVYEFTYTPSKMVGEIKLVATAQKAGVSSQPVMIAINAGPPAELTLMADLMTLSGGQSARITVTVMDASGNGVGGLEDDLDVSTSGSGTVGKVEKGSEFGEYTVTYTAPAVVSADGTEDVTVSIPNSNVSGKTSLALTPVPPREVGILVIIGQVFKENSEVPVSGATVSVTINGVTLETVTEDDGSYIVTHVAVPGVAARTGDRVVIVVTDSTGKRVNVDDGGFALTNEDLVGEGNIATIPRNIETDIKLTATTLVVLGKVYLEDGESSVGAGLTVTVDNPARGVKATGVTDKKGCYDVTLVGLGDTVAETGDALMIMVADGDGKVVEVLEPMSDMPHTLSGDEVSTTKAEVNVTTGLRADPTTVMVVEGTVTNPDGSRAEAGIMVTITIGERDPENTTTNADGAYSYRYTFFGLGDFVAMPGDFVTVMVLREETGERGSKMTDKLLSKDILNRYVQVDVQFPAAIIEITPPMPVSLDSDGDGMVDIVATITDAVGELKTDLTVNAEVTGMGRVTPEATNNGDGTYTVTYTAAPKMIGENLATVTLMAADEPGPPMDSVMVSVVDEMPPTVMAMVDASVVAPEQVVTFDGSGSTDNVGIASYSWDFGDGNSSDMAKVPHTYAAPGTYTAMLTVTDTAGNSADSEMFGVRFPAYEIMVMDPDNVKLDDKGEGMGAIKATVTGTVTKTATAGLAVTAKITDGMGSVSEAKDNGDGTYTFTYTASPKTTGEATVMFMIDDKALGTPVASGMVSVVDALPPTVMARATPSAVGPNQPVAFDGSGTMDNVDDADDLTYSWDLGDGTMSTEAMVEHAYDTQGIYTAKLTVTDTAGNEASSEPIQITVDDTAPTVVSSVTPSVVGLNIPVTFDATGTTDNVDDADTLTYSWDFGDGTEPGTGAKVEHAYDKPGIYNVDLTVTDAAGNMASSETMQIIVGGLVVRGSVVEADRMDLMSPVTVKIMHTGSGEYVMAEVTGADYEAIFQKEQSDKFSAGDSLMVEAHSMGDLGNATRFCVAHTHAG